MALEGVTGSGARRAVVVVTRAAASSHDSGASLRRRDVEAVLARAGYRWEVVPATALAALDGTWDLGVAVSYASAGALRQLTARCTRTWLDAVDSWLLVDGSGLRSGRPSYALRAVRDAARLVAAPTADLVTYISAADLASDRGTVRGRCRLVLPGHAGAPPAVQDGPPRLVAVGDWAYPPNADGLRWLARRVLPRLDQPVHVYGPGPVGEHPLLVRHGYAPQADLYRSGDVHLAPVRFGGGVKRKVLAPLLAGLPVVATGAAAHGLRPHPLLTVADGPAAFAAAATRQLTAGRPALDPPAVLADADDSEAVLRWLAAGPGGGG